MKTICFLHIGTHKTGTTSLQTFLTSNQLCLERNGILIPRSGRQSANDVGHHNLAWELMGDGRFNPAFGSWREVTSEIRSRNPPTVCISSEDFENLYHRPDALARIKQELNSIGYEVRIVVYLRPQADHIESRYVEILKNGGHPGFREYFCEIFGGAASASHSPWAYPFDYRELLDSFAEVFGADRMVVRPYRANRRAKYLLNDFISVISPGHRIRGLDFRAGRRRLNPPLNFAQVMKLLLANPHRNGEGDFDGSIPAGLFMYGRFDPLDLRDLMRIRRRFSEANRILREKYQVNLATMTSRRLLRELMCSAGLNRAGIKRKALLAHLEASRESPQAAVSG